jgi:RHS repeat-associated protein
LENGRGDRYTYDAEGQLTAASYEALTPAGTPTGAQRTESFFYDALGNRKGANVVAGRGTVTFSRRDNGLNQYSNWTPSIIYYDDNSPWAPWTSPPGNGVMMAEGNLVASYNALNQPVAMIPTGWSNAIYFGYDPLGRCVKRWVGSSGLAGSNPATYFYYDGWNLVEEDAGGAAAARLYVHGNRVDEIVADFNYAAPQWRFHHYDARGHCVLLTDASGALIEQYDYDAFGKPYFYNASGVLLGNGSALGNRFLFTGREWLSDLKLYDYRNRMYQPELGRFMQPDPKHFAAGDYNLYRYCHNDPVNKSDPTGLIPDGPITPEESKGMLIGTAAAATVVAVPVAIEEGGAALFSLAARVPFVAQLIGLGTAAEKVAENSSGKLGPNPNIYKELEKQLVKDGPGSITKALGSAKESLATHQEKLAQIVKDGGHPSSVQKTINNVTRQVETLKQFIKDKKLGD